MKKVLLAFQFLTIIPVKEIKEVSEKEMGGASAFFPLIGAFQGLLLVSTSVVFLKVFQAELTNGLLVFVLVLTNGGFHLDGLADTFDAVASRANKEKKLAIMKDSTIGSIGVTAIVLVLLLKFLALNSLFHLSPFTFHLSLFLMPVFSRWAMVPAIFHGKSARQDGLGRIFIENTGVKEFVTATFLTLLFLILAVLIGNKINNPDYQFSIINFQLSLILPVLYIFSLIAVWFSNKNFGGMTGDTLGAVSEISEILFLIMAVICLQNFI